MIKPRTTARKATTPAPTSPLARELGARILRTARTQRRRQRPIKTIPEIEASIRLRDPRLSEKQIRDTAIRIWRNQNPQ